MTYKKNDNNIQAYYVKKKKSVCHETPYLDHDYYIFYLFQYSSRLSQHIPLNNSSSKASVVTIGFFNMLEHEGVVAQFAELHNGVHQGLGVALLTLLVLGTQHDTSSLHGPVQYLLQSRHLTLDDVLNLKVHGHLRPSQKHYITFVFLVNSTQKLIIFSMGSRFGYSSNFKHYLVRQLGFHFPLESPQQEWTKNFVQATNNQNSFLFVQLNLEHD